MFYKIMAVLVVAATLVGCKPAPGGATDADYAAKKSKGGKSKMVLTSSAFKEGDLIPSKYSCDGDDVSPPLSWSGLPKGTVSLALIGDDPDAPGGMWVHWVAYSIPATSTGFPEAVPQDRTLADGTKQGTSDFRKVGYGGPCPPSGTHRYFFKLYALDFNPKLDPGATKSDLLKTIKDHILEEAHLVGKYARKK